MRVLDAAGASRLPHREIAAHLRDTHDVGAWWAQTVTVGYERIRGLRDKGQQRGGGYVVNKSKTFGVPVEALYETFSTARRRRLWLGDEAPGVTTARRCKSLRMVWSDGTKLQAHFWRKGAAKSQVQLQHGEFATKAAADRLRQFWTERLAELARLLRS